jgi:N-acetylmuramic acid 6-phosphate (MurNAc-6-P) etherase
MRSLPENHAPATSRIDLDDDDAVSRLIKQAGSVKLAAIMARWGCSLAEARERLDEAAGVLKAALDNVS